MSYQITVIGGGPAGYVAAIRAAQLGAKVALVEKGELGGTCLNRGCIPTKALVAGAELIYKFNQAQEFGIEVQGIQVDFNRLMERKRAVVSRLVKGVNYLIKKNKINLIKGKARIEAPGRVVVATPAGNQEVILTEKILLATGSEPALIESLGYDGKMVITSDEALELESLPESLIIVGAGVVGCEFAGIFQSLGVEVTLVEAMPTILPMVDREVSRLMQTLFKKRGIGIKTGVKVEEVIKEGDLVRVKLDSGEEITARKVLISIGRVLNTRGIGLEEIGLALGPRGEILVNEGMETNIPGIFAAGDITAKIQLAHVASAQGMVAVENMLGLRRVMDYRVVPSCIFTIPEIASVGLTSQEAQERGIPIKVGKFPYLASGKALAMGETEGFVKILAEEGSGKILGVHILGAHASDLIAEGALAMSLGATLEELVHTIHAHPTLPEMVLEAGEAALGRAIHL